MYALYIIKNERRKVHIKRELTQNYIGPKIWKKHFLSTVIKTKTFEMRVFSALHSSLS